MMKRTISAVILLMIGIPLVVLGGVPYRLGIFVISLMALKEFLDIKQIKKELPIFISLISYIVMGLFVLSESGNSLIFTIDFRIIAGLFLVFLTPVVLYHDQSIYSIVDAFYLIGGMFFLGASFSLFILMRTIDLNLILYLFTITIATDVYAYLIGLLIGKHPMTSISPKKSIEGLIAGTIFGTILGTVFYLVVLDPTAEFYVILFVSCFLSILGQFGDLVFSAIKRYYGKKDFSNLIPGHGGILDRFDSIIFVVLGFLFFLNIL